jgi:ACR3 family arsenite efflux pump ArsB
METLFAYLLVPLLALQDKTIQVQIGGGHWYHNPVWIAIGILAAVVILLLIIVAARGSGGTTIVKD